MSDTLPTWTVDTGDGGKCPCRCPENLTLTVLYSSQAIDGTWEPFIEFPYPGFAAGNAGGVRIQMNYSGALFGGHFVRARELILHNVTPPADGYELGDDVLFQQIGEDESGTLVDASTNQPYHEIPKTTVENDEIWLVGPPGRATVILIGKRQEQEFTKQGIAAFAGQDGDVAKLFKKETISGSAPGFPVVSGFVEFTALTDPVTGITNPTGTYSKTDGANDGRFARPPVGYIGVEKTFGQVTDTATTRDEDDGENALSILLENEYTTDELTDAVADSLAIQLAAGPLTELAEGVVSKHFLSLDQRTLWRVDSQLQFRIAAGAAFAGNGTVIQIPILYDLLTVDLFSGLQTPSTGPAILSVTVADVLTETPDGSPFAQVTGPVFAIPSGDNAEIWLTNLRCEEVAVIVAPPGFVIELPE